MKYTNILKLPSFIISISRNYRPAYNAKNCISISGYISTNQWYNAHCQHLPGYDFSAFYLTPSWLCLSLWLFSFSMYRFFLQFHFQLLWSIFDLGSQLQHVRPKFLPAWLLARQVQCSLYSNVSACNERACFN